LELSFYRYAVFYQEFPNSEVTIEKLLSQDVKCPGWYLRDVTKLARKKGHPDYKKLCQYEKRIISQ